MSCRIAFVGVGRMGANMARRLEECGYEIVAVYDSHGETAASVAGELSAVRATTLTAITAAADLVFTVVTDDAAQLAIFSETGDSLLVGAKGKTFVNCATLTPAVHVELERRAKTVGAVTMEACMASSIPQARNGTLFLMCGGARETFEALRPVLEKLSTALSFVGTAGQAAQVKALVNMVMNINTAGLAEGLGLGAALGLDLNLLREIFSQTGANSQVLKTDGEDMQNRAHDCYFSASHAAKDSGIALKLGQDAGLSLPLAEATTKQFARLVAQLTFKGRQG